MNHPTDLHPSRVRAGSAPSPFTAAVLAGQLPARNRSHTTALIVAAGAGLGIAVASPAWASTPADSGELPSATYASQRAAEHQPSPTLGDLPQWAWALRLERELCARYGDTSCS